MSDEKRALRKQLDTHGVDGVYPLLVAAWDSLEGSDEHAMASFKLARLEEPSWDPPLLSFLIERHGGTVQGSSRAEVRRWLVDLDAWTAELDPQYRSVRQLHKMNARLDVRPVAREIAAAIAGRVDDPRLKWSTDRTTVQPVLSRILPEQPGVPKQTLEGRRRRLRDALREELDRLGWMPAQRQGWYVR